MKRSRVIFIIVLWAVIGALQSQSEGHEAGENADWSGVSIDENLGKKAPLEAVFLDEHGNKTTLGRFVDRPTLVLPVYYTCPQSCGILLGNLASALNDVPLKPGKDYRVLAFSIDYEDNPSNALQAKKNYVKILKKGFPEAEWKFFSGNNVNIHRFTDTVGYRFRRTGRHNFIHPNVLIVLARGGTVIRYIYGPFFLPFDIAMALTEATKGVPAISVRKLLSYCFSYEPKNKTYSFRIVRILGIGFMILLGIMFFFLLRKKSHDR
jgi:protein SCO1/2